MTLGASTCICLPFAASFLRADDRESVSSPKIRFLGYAVIHSLNLFIFSNSFPDFCFIICSSSNLKRGFIIFSNAGSFITGPITASKVKPLLTNTSNGSTICVRTARASFATLGNSFFIAILPTSCTKGTYSFTTCFTSLITSGSISLTAALVLIINDLLYL